MFRQLTSEVTFFQHATPALTEQHVARLTTWDIRVLTEPVESVEVADDLNAQMVSAAAAGAAISGDLVAEDAELTIKVLAPTYSEERYGEGKRVWSGKANLHVETTAADLPAGTAPNVGIGGGWDAIWLASHGSSSTWCPRRPAAAQARTPGHASQAGRGRPSGRNAARRRSPPGRLGRTDAPQSVPAAPDVHRRGRRHPAGPEWDITTLAAERPATDPESRPITPTDAVLRAVRRPAE